MFFAHSNPKHPEDRAKWEPLLNSDGHLEAVSQKAQVFSELAFHSFPGGAVFWTQLSQAVASWHDLGKFSEEFQNYLKIASTTGDDTHTGEMKGRVDHTSAGAQHAISVLPSPMGAMAAYLIAGHHAGLHDGLSRRACLKNRLTKSKIPPWKVNVPAELLSPPTLKLPEIPGSNHSELAFNLAFATRMLFSCLVDADFLATESFMSPEKSEHRPTGEIDFAELDEHLTAYINQHFSSAKGSVAEARSEVLMACLSAAEEIPGLYSLTVPTGGGKTLSSLAFALRHSVRKGLGQVIYAIPFTSIIEQTAQTFREVFADFETDADELVLEHHSNFDPDDETDRSRLASENWDAPIVVTTNVQLFESLFANRTSRCRKLHRIAGSVIILDEVQTLPVTLLAPCLKALRLLVEQYGCTIVLCTATLPAIEYRANEFKIGLPQVTPIIQDAPALYERLKRVEVKNAGVLDCTQLTEHMAATKQALAIVNTRRHAADLYRCLMAQRDEEGCFHLSAAMTPEHRTDRLNEIRRRLKEDLPCQVVATQLIEAGVDVDFPVVFRALAGLDSIAQAAGRCNREGRRDSAVTWIFTPDPAEHSIPRGYLRRCADAAEQIIALNRYTDLLTLPAIEHYFRLHYWQHNDQWDASDIIGQFSLANEPTLPLRFNFASVAERFKFIPDLQRPIIIANTDKGRELVERLRGTEAMGTFPPRDVVRRLQRHSVTVAEQIWMAALADGHLELLHDRYAVLTTPEHHYSPKMGLQLDADPLYDPNLICCV
ncbi:MAG: CRISPR-associated helicase Cas3' [Candidatus Sedimenticola sp. (ex Thyasira tokunagai)]